MTQFILHSQTERNPQPHKPLKPIGFHLLHSGLQPKDLFFLIIFMQFKLLKMERRPQPLKRLKPHQPHQPLKPPKPLKPLE